MSAILPEIVRLVERGATVTFEPTGKTGVCMRIDHERLDRHMLKVVPGVEAIRSRDPDAPLRHFLHEADAIWTGDIWADPTTTEER